MTTSGARRTSSAIGMGRVAWGVEALATPSPKLPANRQQRDAKRAPDRHPRGQRNGYRYEPNRPCGLRMRVHIDVDLATRESEGRARSTAANGYAARAVATITKGICDGARTGIQRTIGIGRWRQSAEPKIVDDNCLRPNVRRNRDKDRICRTDGRRRGIAEHGLIIALRKYRYRQQQGQPKDQTTVVSHACPFRYRLPAVAGTLPERIDDTARIRKDFP